MAVQSKSFCVQALRVKNTNGSRWRGKPREDHGTKVLIHSVGYVTINVQLHQASGRVEKGRTDIKLINYGNEHV